MRPIFIVASVLTLSATLAACGDDNGKKSGAGKSFQAPEGTFKYSIKDGPDICFKLVKEKLGASAKIEGIESSFNAGPSLEGHGQTTPQGVLEKCVVRYQNPDKSTELLSMKLDEMTGDFKKPRPVQINVSGDASKFVLDSILMPLGQVDTSWVQAYMDKKKPSMSETFKEYAWTMLNLKSPGALTNQKGQHLFMIYVDGRYKSNDIKDSGWAEFTLDGKLTSASKVLR